MLQAMIVPASSLDAYVSQQILMQRFQISTDKASRARSERDRSMYGRKKEEKLNGKESLGVAGFQRPPVGPVWIKENRSCPCMPKPSKDEEISKSL